MQQSLSVLFYLSFCCLVTLLPLLLFPALHRRRLPRKRNGGRRFFKRDERDFISSKINTRVANGWIRGKKRSECRMRRKKRLLLLLLLLRAMAADGGKFKARRARVLFPGYKRPRGNFSTREEAEAWRNSMEMRERGRFDRGSYRQMRKQRGPSTLKN